MQPGWRTVGDASSGQPGGYNGNDSRRNLVVYLEPVAGDNVLALAQLVRCPHSIPHSWVDGATVPRLENLLRVCLFLNVPASSLFVPSGPTSANIGAAKEAIAIAGNRGVFPSRHESEIRHAPLVLLDKEVPRSLSQVAQGMGYITPTEISARRSPLDFGSRAAAIGGESRERPEFATPPRGRRYWNDRSNRTSRPRLIASPRTLATRTTDTFARSIRNSAGKSATKLRLRSKPNLPLSAVPWKRQSRNTQRQPRRT